MSPEGNQYTPDLGVRIMDMWSPKYKAPYLYRYQYICYIEIEQGAACKVDKYPYASFPIKGCHLA